MCGIVGVAAATGDAVPVLIDGLQRLEYRGYDSAGIAFSSGNGITAQRCSGKISGLVEKLKKGTFQGTSGLGHTRWATHGPPTEQNAHPHSSCDGRIIVVHNGIIENFSEIREDLADHKYRSQTDTEVLAHLIESVHKGDPLKAVAKALKKVKGTYALGVMFADHPNTLIAARLNAPLLVGVAEDRMLLASDLSALLPYTKKVIVLDEGEIARLTPGKVEVFDRGLKKRRAKVVEIDWTVEVAEKGGYPHFMLKEIHEQPETAAAEISGRIRGDNVDVDLPVSLMKRVKRMTVAACGTAWHSGLVAKYAFEELAGLPVDLGFASEVRYGDTPFDRSTLMLAISQSGETADTLAAARLAREHKAPVVAITNVKGSTISREADRVVHMRSGIEIGVAATKTYTSQLINVLLLAVAFGRARGTLPAARARKILGEIKRLPGHLAAILKNTNEIQNCGEKFKSGYDFMYIGRRYNMATAFEGALKMKEISYLHAEGYGGGEMKHGPLALVDERLTTVAVAVQGRVYDKMISNIEEIRARKGNVITIANAGDRRAARLADHVLSIPACDEIVSPVAAVVPLQLLAYHTAVACDRDVDQPRNLAKSVTVE